MPSGLILSNAISNEALLIRLLCGTLKVEYFSGDTKKKFIQKTDYSSFNNTNNTSLKSNIIKDFFSLESLKDEEKEKINKYLLLNRKNFFIHEQLLSELTSAIIWAKNSPVESFVHIYRSLEFMSYSFPLIYTSKSMDYRGSYEKLKKFFNGDANGELKFFKTFLNELFKDNILNSYEFEAFFLNSSDLIKEELNKVIAQPYYTFDENTMKIKFLNIIDLIIIIRNRYFHMLIGTGNYNFYDIQYDKREIFKSLNPIFITWLTIIYKEIATYSLGIV